MFVTRELSDTYHAQFITDHVHTRLVASQIKPKLTNP